VNCSVTANGWVRNIIAMLGLEELSQEDRRTVQRARRIERSFNSSYPANVLRISCAMQ